MKNAHKSNTHYQPLEQCFEVWWWCLLCTVISGIGHSVLYIFLSLCMCTCGKDVWSGVYRHFRQCTELFFVCFWYKLGFILCGVWFIGSFLELLACILLIVAMHFNRFIILNKKLMIHVIYFIFMCVWESYIMVNFQK